MLNSLRPPGPRRPEEFPARYPGTKEFQLAIQYSDPDLPERGRDRESPITVNDVGFTEEDLLAAIDATIKPFGDGDLVSGTVVKIDKEEVLVDIGY
ncbi:MAG: hypothetical protein ACREJP_06095, partial [Candidatus Methylomirabilales bacterium]